MYVVFYMDGAEIDSAGIYKSKAAAKKDIRWDAEHSEIWPFPGDSFVAYLYKGDPRFALTLEYVATFVNGKEVK